MTTKPADPMDNPELWTGLVSPGAHARSAPSGALIGAKVGTLCVPSGRRHESRRRAGLRTRRRPRRAWAAAGSEGTYECAPTSPLCFPASPTGCVAASVAAGLGRPAVERHVVHRRLPPQPQPDAQRDPGGIEEHRLDLRQHQRRRLRSFPPRLYVTTRPDQPRPKCLTKALPAATHSGCAPRRTWPPASGRPHTSRK